MAAYIAKRILALIPVLIGITFFIYVIMGLSPGDPAFMMLGEAATPQSIQQLRGELGLDQPLITQYGKYMLRLVRGDMGLSYVSNKPVAIEIKACFPYTLRLTGLAMILAVIIAIPLGILSAIRHNTLVDLSGMLLSLLGISMPSFLTGTMLILVFSVKLGFLPAGGIGGISYYIMPGITLAFGSLAVITRTARTSMLDVLNMNFTRTIRAKGLSGKEVILRHVFPNALIPTLTAIGLEVGTALGGAVVTETIFSWPGIGRLMLQAIQQKNTPMVLACTILFAVSFSLINLIVDILYAFIDPRIRY
jgi:peptide/nickel transport system permease protein